MKRIHFINLLLPFAFLLFIIGCSKDSDTPEVINEAEVINEVTLTINDGSGNTQTVTWNEGDSNTQITLTAGNTYTVTAGFYDATDPADKENITEEVIEEVDEHQVFYEIANGANLVISSASGDTLDSNQTPLFLVTDWTAGEASEGIVRLYLIHQPTSKTGTTRNDFGGETDVQVDFSIQIN